MIHFSTTIYARQRNLSLEDCVGALPLFWDPADPRKAVVQHDSHNPPGGPWSPFSDKWTRDPATEFLQYGDPAEEDADPPIRPLAIAILPLTRERIVVYESAWVCIVQDDGTFEVDRRD